MFTLGLKPKVDTASSLRTLRHVKTTEAWSRLNRDAPTPGRRPLTARHGDCRCHHHARSAPVQGRGCCVTSHQRLSASVPALGPSSGLRLGPYGLSKSLPRAISSQITAIKLITGMNTIRQIQPLLPSVLALGHEGALSPDEEPVDDSFCSFEQFDQRKDN